jgi:hypothetical protein
VTPPAARVQNSAAVGEGGGSVSRRVSTAERQRVRRRLDVDFPPASRQHEGAKNATGRQNRKWRGGFHLIGIAEPSFLSHKSQNKRGMKKRDHLYEKVRTRAYEDLKI